LLRFIRQSNQGNLKKITKGTFDMILQEMIVTNAEGKIQTAKNEKLTGQCIQGEDVYTFYAIK